MHFLAAVLVPFYTDWGHISLFQIMILQSVFVFSVFLLEIPTGAIADYWGRKASLILSLIIATIAPIVYSSSPHFLVFIFGEILFALAVALYSGADESLLYDSLKECGMEEQSKKYLGAYSSAQLSAIMISAPIGSLIAATLGLRYTMLFLSIPLFLSIFIAAALKEPAIASTRQKTSYILTLKQGVSYFRNHPILKILTLDTVFISAGCFFLIWLYQVVLQKLGISIIMFGVIHAAIAAIQIVFYNTFDFWEKLFRSKRNYILWSALISGFSFMLLSINTTFVVAFILFLFIAGFGMTRMILINNYIHKHIDSSYRATVMSTISMFRQLTRGILYPIIGFILIYSIELSFFVIGAGIILVALISQIREEHLID